MDPGDIIQDRYKIVRYIKRGGMGAVYEARDTKLADSPCAVKEILEGVRTGQDSQYVEARFFQEMKALSALDHPSIPKVRDYLTVDSVIYIVMELVQGQSLDDEIQQSMGLTGQPLPAERCVEDVLALLDTVQYLHEQQPPIIHRDIKPANILRETRSGRIKLVDFGLARQLDDNSRHTLVGTLGYCAPEQMMGKGSFESDLYSVGMTLYHMLTGKQPEMLNLDALAPELPGLRPGLTEIVEKATQPRPAERYHTCQQMIHDLKAWLAAEPPPRPVTQVARPEPPPRQQNPIVPAQGNSSLLLGLGAVALALAFGLFMGRETAPSPPTAAATSTPVPIARLQPAAGQAPVEETGLEQPPAPVPVVAPSPAQKVAQAPRPVPPPVSRPIPPTRPDPRPSTPPASIERPNPEVGTDPAYPTYQGPPIQVSHPDVGLQVQPPAPDPQFPTGGPPEGEPGQPQGEPTQPQAQSPRRLRQWLRNHPNYKQRMNRRF